MRLLDGRKWPALVLAAAALGWILGRFSAPADATGRPPEPDAQSVPATDDVRAITEELSRLRTEVERLSSRAPRLSVPPDAGPRRRIEDQDLPADNTALARRLDDSIAAGGEDRAYAVQVRQAALEALLEAGLDGSVEVAALTCGLAACRITLRHSDLVSAEMMNRLHSRGPFRAEMFTSEAPLSDGSSGTFAYIARPGHRLWSD